MGIFISYRRSESQEVISRVYDRLAGHFGRDQVFRDMDTIRPGADFSRSLERAISYDTVVLVAIGPHWASVVDPQGRPRLHDSRDFVHQEVLRALRAGSAVLPRTAKGSLLDFTPD